MQPRRVFGSAEHTPHHGIWRSLGALVCGIVSACVHISQDEGLSFNGGPSSEPSADASPRSSARSIELDISSEQVAPGDTVTIEIRVKPKTAHDVQLLLTTDSVGAFLDHSRLTTDETGRAEVTLSVTNEASSVTVQATSGEATARVTVEVSKTPTATLRIRPDYRGRRSVPGYWITLSNDADCSDESRYWSEDAEHVDAFEDLIVENYLATAPLTVHARIESYAFGCQSGIDLSPAHPNIIDLLLVDRPLQLEELELSLGLNLTSDLSQQLDTLVQQMTAAFRTPSAEEEPATDVDTLLDQMAAHSQEPEQFLAWRHGYGWDRRLESALTTQGAEVGLSSRVRRWLEGGAALLTSERAFVGRVYSGTTPKKAWFELEQVQGMDPQAAYMPSLHQASLLTSGDEVTFAFTLWFKPSSLLAALAQVPVRSAGFDDVVEALDMSVACPSDAGMMRCSLCERVGQVLAVPLLAETPDASCDETCLSRLCLEALEQRWASVESAHTELASMAVAAASRAELDSEARVVGLSGTWVGETDLLGAGFVPLEGPFSATPADEVADSEP